MFRVQREELVDEITRKGITDLAVIKAIGIVPREKFVEKTMHHMAYRDVALPIGFDQRFSLRSLVCAIRGEFRPDI